MRPHTVRRPRLALGDGARSVSKTLAREVTEKRRGGGLVVCCVFVNTRGRWGGSSSEKRRGGGFVVYCIFVHKRGRRGGSIVQRQGEGLGWWFIVYLYTQGGDGAGQKCRDKVRGWAGCLLCI